MDPFERSRIGTTKVEVTRLGLGTAPLGGWPTAVSREQGLATIERAWARGVRYFDTAPFYGHGKAEGFLGSVLSDRSRGDFALSTKVGRVLEEGAAEASIFEDAEPMTPVFDFTPDGVLRSLASSRGRLGFDRLDIALIHDPDEHHTEAIEQTYPKLAELRAAGQLGAIGVGMNWSEPLARFAEEADFDCFLLAGRYTLLEQGAMDELLPLCLERGASILAGGVYNSGLLVDPKPGAHYNYAPVEPDVLDRAQRIAAVCGEFGVPVRAAAIQFPLAHPSVACVIPGARTPGEVDDNVEMLQLPIPGELWGRLKELDLLRADAPVPAGA